MLYVWSGWRAVCGGAGWVEYCAGDQWKSWALTCRTCEKDLLLCGEVLKAAVKVALGAKYPALHFTTHCRTFVKTEMMPKNKRVINCYSPTQPKWKQLQAVNFSGHVWILAVLIADGCSNFSSASEGRFLLKRAICSDGGRLRGAATLILWNACTGRRGSEIAKA